MPNGFGGGGGGAGAGGGVGGGCSYTGRGFEKKYVLVFAWNEIPGNDTARLIDVLTQEFGIDWAKIAKIEKIDNGKTIKVFNESNSLSLKLDDKNNEVILEFGDGGTFKFRTEMKNGKLNIYYQGKRPEPDQCPEKCLRHDTRCLKLKNHSGAHECPKGFNRPGHIW